jgi:signal transduction histidine kinase
MLWELKEYWKSRIFAYVLDVQLLNIPEDTAKRSVKGNRQLLLVALQNMIKNAFKFSHNQPVSVRLSYSPDGMTMAISDKGIGIIPEDLERIFMPLYRADNAHNFPGYGIGLSMSHKILQLHGASIHVFSEAGRGATFSISFNRMR